VGWSTSRDPKCRPTGTNRDLRDPMHLRCGDLMHFDHRMASIWMSLAKSLVIIADIRDIAFNWADVNASSMTPCSWPEEECTTA
jgi:hypothetical protein